MKLLLNGRGEEIQVENARYLLMKKIFGTRSYYIFKNGKVEEKVIDKSIKLK
jgi:hypothetical protein